MDDGKELGLSDGTDVGSAVGQMEMLGFIDGCESYGTELMVQWNEQNLE